MCLALDSLLITKIVDPIVVNLIAQSGEVPHPECLAEGGAWLQVQGCFTLWPRSFICSCFLALLSSYPNTDIYIKNRQLTAEKE